MALIDIEATVTAPAKVNVQLIRADHAATTNIFRVFFEIFLSIFSTLLGYILALDKPTTVHWVFLFVIGGAAVAFISVSISYSRKAHAV